MTGVIATVFDVLAANRTAWRRARNLRAARQTAPRQAAVRAAPAPAWRLGAPGWIGAAGVLFALAGAVAIAMHARTLAGQVQAPMPAAVLQRALPGVSFTVPPAPGAVLGQHEDGAMLVMTAMQGLPPLRIDLCTQMLDPARPRLLPLRVGLRFDDVARLAARNEAAASPATLRNIVMSAPGSTMPRLEIGGMAAHGTPLTLRWDGGAREAEWIGDASGGAIARGTSGHVQFLQQGWLVWDGGSLRAVRRASAQCPQAGELVLQSFGAATPSPANAMVVAFPANGDPVPAWLPPGRYHVPVSPAPSREDQSLFERLRERGLVRLGASGLLEMAPPDYAGWRSAPPHMRLEGPAPWDGLPMDGAVPALLERLYRKADGAYLREQVRIFNSERRLLAWRVRSDAAARQWYASAGEAPANVTTAMPPAAARLFDRLPAGWAPWTRVDWPDHGASGNARLTLALPQPAAGGETLQLMVAGRVTHAAGAHIRARHPACSGRACPSGDAVELIDLELQRGALGVALDATPLDISGLSARGDEQYRHLRMIDGRVEWLPLPGQVAPARPAAAQVVLADRNGTPLWRDGKPLRYASAAGLAPLLGVRAAHRNSVAGMLARLPSPAGTPHSARLSIDLALQAASQAALDCIGMRRGRWDGSACAGGAPAPADRQAGLVVIDAENGDVLAAAGSGTARLDAAAWDELRDFDRADPARSPLRLPAFQHDGGAQRGPGSTFKVISALGLEAAAQRNPQLDALLDGLPLADINRFARGKGFGFATGAPAYPAHTARARITNFRGQPADRRAEDGRLGLKHALAHSANTWFAWTAELSDRSLFGRPEGGVPGLKALEPAALADVRPIAGMAQRLGFDRPLRMDGGLLPAGYAWSQWDALQTTPARIDPIHTRHELRQMAIGLRMQATPLQMALVSAAVGQGRVVAPRLLLELDDRAAGVDPGPRLGVRLDRIRAGMKAVVDSGTAAGAFRGREFDAIRPGLYGKTGTAPTGQQDAAGKDLATVWFTGWIEPGTLPGQARRLAVAAFVSHSGATGGEHAAPIVAAVLKTMQGRPIAPDGG